MPGKPFYLGKPMALLKGLQAGELNRYSIENRTVFNIPAHHDLNRKDTSYAPLSATTVMCPNNNLHEAVTHEFRG